MCILNLSSAEVHIDRILAEGASVYSKVKVYGVVNIAFVHLHMSGIPLGLNPVGMGVIPSA